MTTAQTEALTGMATVLVILALLVLPSLAGIVRDRRVDRQIREAQKAGEAQEMRGVVRKRPACNASRITVG